MSKFTLILQKKISIVSYLANLGKKRKNSFYKQIQVNAHEGTAVHTTQLVVTTHLVVMHSRLKNIVLFKYLLVLLFELQCPQLCWAKVMLEVVVRWLRTCSLWKKLWAVSGQTCWSSVG